MTPLVDLSGKRGLVVGIANESSIAAGCAAAFRQCGARLAATYLNERARPYVEPIAERLNEFTVTPPRVAVSPLGDAIVTVGAVRCALDYVEQNSLDLELAAPA